MWYVYFRFGENVKIVHFIGAAKPWLQYFDTESRQVHPSPGLQHLQAVLQRWWDIFFSLIQPDLTTEMVSLWILLKKHINILAYIQYSFVYSCCKRMQSVSYRWDYVIFMWWMSFMKTVVGRESATIQQ